MSRSDEKVAAMGRTGGRTFSSKQRPKALMCVRVQNTRPGTRTTSEGSGSCGWRGGLSGRPVCISGSGRREATDTADVQESQMGTPTQWRSISSGNKRVSKVFKLNPSFLISNYTFHSLEELVI